MGDDSLGNVMTLCDYCHMEEHGHLSYTIPAVRVFIKPKPRKK